MAHDVFISHSSANKATADAICHALEQKGIRCWIAPRDILAGSQYGEQITKGIRNCKMFLLVFSDEVNHSPAVQKELERAILGYKKIVVPFRIEDVPMNDNIEYFLGDVHWIDAYPNDTVFENLTSAISRILGKDEGKPKKTEDPGKSDVEGDDKEDEPPHPPPPSQKRKLILCIAIGLLLLFVALIVWQFAGVERIVEHPTPDITDYITIRDTQYSTSLTELKLIGMGLTDDEIEPLQYMVNLKYLFLWNNQISDLTPLEGLTNLTELRLCGNQITDITPLSGLINLDTLSLGSNYIIDLMPLANLTNPVSLDLRGNWIYDWSPVEHLVHVYGRPRHVLEQALLDFELPPWIPLEYLEGHWYSVAVDGSAFIISFLPGGIGIFIDLGSEDSEGYDAALGFYWEILDRTITFFYPLAPSFDRTAHILLYGNNRLEIGPQTFTRVLDDVGICDDWIFEAAPELVGTWILTDKVLEPLSEEMGLTTYDVDLFHSVFGEEITFMPNEFGTIPPEEIGEAHVFFTWHAFTYMDIGLMLVMFYYDYYDFNVRGFLFTIDNSILIVYDRDGSVLTYTRQ